MAGEKKVLYLLDAYALIFRAYYAFIRNPRINSKGLNTSAIFGFTNVLFETLTKREPTHVAVVFDHKSKTLRAQEFDFYKANRDETPEDIKLSEPWIRKIIEAFNVPILEAEGYEADDVIGTLSVKAEEAGFEVFMMTPDKDYAQLVTENVKMFKPGRSGKPPEIWGVEEVKENFEVEDTKQVIDILGLMGDAVDNIPGVPGVGPKKATDLVKTYGSVEGVLEHADEIKGKMGENIRENKESAIISKKLATIILDVPVEFNEESLIVEEMNKDAMKELFSDLEFRTLGKRIIGEEFKVDLPSENGGQISLFDEPPAGETTDLPERKDVKRTYKAVQEEAEINKLIEEMKQAKVFAFDTETTGLDALTCDIVGMSFSCEAGKAYYVPCPEDRDSATSFLAQFKDLFADTSLTKVGHNIKYDMHVLRQYGVEVSAPIKDTMVTHYVLDGDSRHGMDFLAETFLGIRPIPIEDLIGKKGKNQGSMKDVPLEQITEYASEDADITYQFMEIFDKMADEKKAQPLLDDIETPLIHVLLDMETEGVKLDDKFLSDYSSELEKETLTTRDAVFKEAGTEFNLDSPKQLGEVLFDHMKIPYKGKKTKTGQYSTNEDTLKLLAEEHPIIGSILNYRELTKLRSTYVDALPALINERTGRVHSTFNQTIAATGRLSSVGPNLQNIPIRTERGRKIRQAFIPRSDEFQLLSADYSQVELRIIAAISQDANMIQAFKDGLDIHSATAAKVFDVAQGDVTPEMRRQAKAVNFGLAYGQSAFGLAQTLGISRTDARAIIDNYFNQFPGIKDYMSDTVKFAQEHGYVETLFKRRRYLRDINSANHTVRSFAERNAINSPIQGSAADVIKIAMINIHKEMQKMDLQSKMILQVHDELVFDVHKDEIEEVSNLVVNGMEGAADIGVPLTVEHNVANNWLDAH